MWIHLIIYSILAVIIVNLTTRIFEKSKIIRHLNSVKLELENNVNLLLKLNRQEFNQINLNSTNSLKPYIATQMEKQLADYYYFVFYSKDNSVQLTALGEYILYCYTCSNYNNGKWSTKKALTLAIQKIPEEVLNDAVLLTDKVLKEGILEEIEVSRDFILEATR